MRERGARSTERRGVPPSCSSTHSLTLTVPAPLLRRVESLLESVHEDARRTTVGLRRLQARDQLENLLSQLAETRHRSPVFRPILVKLAPDLTDAELDDALGAILDTGMDGVITTNTTISRGGLRSPVGQESGGLSGAPLTRQSLNIVEKIYSRIEDQIPIVGVGGIMSSDDAKAMLAVGAKLIQVYTGLIYAGPGLVKAIVESL